MRVTRAEIGALSVMSLIHVQPLVDLEHDRVDPSAPTVKRIRHDRASERSVNSNGVAGALEQGSDRDMGEAYTLDKVLFTGFYPPIHDRKLKPPLWYGNYVRTYVEREIRQILNVRDLSTFRRFVRLCAGRIGQLLNLSQLAMDCGTTHNTAKAWISILEAS